MGLRYFMIAIGMILITACSNRSPESLSTSDSTGQKKENKLIVNLAESYWQVYGGREALAIKSIEESADVGGRLIIKLQASTDDFSHFLIAKNSAVPETISAGMITADFDIYSSEPEVADFKVILVAQNGERSQPYQIELIGNSSKYWSSRGAMGYPNWVTVKTNPFINFLPRHKVEDWIYKKPNTQEIKFAHAKWGKLIRGVKSNYEKAKILAKSLLDDLTPHIGTPSDSMYARPFVQYERMVSGKDKGFCSNFAHIFIHACNSFGIPARRIHLQKIHSKSESDDKLSVRMGGMHSTAEIFDAELNQWILMDYYSNALGFFLGGQGPLTALEFGLFLNEPARRKNLMMIYYDPETKEEKMIEVSNNTKTQYASFDGRDTEYHFFIKNK